MFTGIVSDVGEVASSADAKARWMRLAVACAYPAASIEIGASIATAGLASR